MQNDLLVGLDLGHGEPFEIEPLLRVGRRDRLAELHHPARLSRLRRGLVPGAVLENPRFSGHRKEDTVNLSTVQRAVHRQAAPSNWTRGNDQVVLANVRNGKDWKDPTVELGGLKSLDRAGSTAAYAAASCNAQTRRACRAATAAAVVA